MAEINPKKIIVKIGDKEMVFGTIKRQDTIVKKDNVYTDYMEAVEYNRDLCSTIAMEECAELIQAISKAKRGKLDKDNMAEEIADVFICVDWISKIYEIDEGEVVKWYDMKRKRIVERLNKEEFK